MPPSVNALYIKRRGGGLALSKAANKYREHVKHEMNKRMGEISVFPTDMETVYRILLVCHMQNLENDGWFQAYEKDTYFQKDSKERNKDGSPKNKKGALKARKGDRKAATRYKKVDVDNRVKFVQDCVVKGLGIPDDSQIFEGTQRKVWTDGPEYVEVTMTVVDRDQFFSNGGGHAKEDAG